MSDHFESPRQVLDSARDHINDLQSRTAAFFERKPYAPVIDYDSATGQNVHKIRLTAKIPGKMTGVTKDAITNLRDCLDHTVYASCAALGRSANQTKFPFADSGLEFEGELWALKEVSPVIWSVIERFRPYKGGNDLLWALNKIRNTKTHRILVPIAAASTGSSLQISGAVQGPAAIGYNRWSSTKNEVEFMRVGRGSDVRYDVNVTFDVLLGDIEVIGGKPAIGTLNAIFSEVESVLMAIEAETDRLLRGT